MKVLTDLSRLMLDDGQNIKVKLSDPDIVAYVEYIGKTWAAYKVTKEMVGYCWILDTCFNGDPDSNTNMNAFLTNPNAFVNRFMSNDGRPSQIGYYQAGYPSTETRWTLVFKEVP